MACARRDTRKHCIGDIETNRIVADIGLYLFMLYVHRVTHITLYIFETILQFLSF